MYSADLRAAKSDSERLERLQQNLRCAWEIYQQRVSSEGPAAATLLGEEVAVATTRQTHFGHELAVVASRANILPFDVSSSTAAHAS